jgi:Flp pilus assembly protein TadG
MGRKYASQEGAAMVEFALILGPLMLFTFAIIEFGIFLYDKNVIVNASREGARAGIVASTHRLPVTGTNSIASVVQNYCSTYLVTFGAQNTPVSTITGYSDTAPIGSTLTVRVNYTYSFLVIPDLLLSYVSGFDKVRYIEATTAMRYE